MRDILDDILLGLRLWRHHYGGYPVEDLFVVYWHTGGCLIQ
jgi:hypothetical protein